MRYEIISMGFKEEEVKKAAEIKIWIEEKISDLESEVGKLKETLKIVDSLLRVASFKAAASFVTEPKVKSPPSSTITESQKYEKLESEKTIPIKRSADDFFMGNAFISKSSVIIIPEIEFDISTPPFRSFFINRILEGMKNKDEKNTSQGRIKEEDAIKYTIEEKNGIIKKITVYNYKDTKRLNDIINSITWTFTKMSEKLI